jgi:hypothetical protein
LKIYQGFDLGKKNSKLFHACVPLKKGRSPHHHDAFAQTAPLQTGRTFPSLSFSSLFVEGSILPVLAVECSILGTGSIKVWVSLKGLGHEIEFEDFDKNRYH